VTAPQGRGDTFIDFSCEECTPEYEDLGVEGFASAEPCEGCLALELWYSGATYSNYVAPSSFPPPAGYDHVKTLAYALPLEYPGPAATVVLELWGGSETVPIANPPTHPTFFTLASAKSRALAQQRGLKLVAQVARLLTAPVTPDIARVAALAAAADVAVLFVSTPSSEGSDRPDLDLSDADNALVAAVTAAQPRTVVVMNSPAAIVTPWADQAGAMVAAWYGGQEMGNSIADVLFGDVNPAGRLPMTWPMLNSDNPLPTPEQYPGVNGTVVYSEGLFIDYRWYDANAVVPRFPFGHGLSYTNFSYSNLVIDTTSQAPNVTVTFDVGNSGARDGEEVAQLYLTFPASAGEPPQVLRGFAKYSIPQGYAQAMQLVLTPRDMSVWAPTPAYEWQLARGTFGVGVGASSRDIRLRGSFSM